MNGIVRKIFGSVARLFSSVRETASRWLNPPYRTQIVEEALPRELRPRVLYVVQEDGFKEQAALLCPCGCRRTLHLNLLPDERPCWTLTRHNDGTSTLHPSVWRKKDCGSHFWFRRGRILWSGQNRGRLLWISVIHYLASRLPPSKYGGPEVPSK